MQDGDLILKINADLNGELNNKLKDIDSSIADIGRSGSKIESSLVTAFKNVEQKAQNLSTSINKIQTNLNSLARTSRNTLLGLSAGAGLAVKKYSEFESGILKVQTISDKSFKDIKKTAEELSVKYGISVGQITEGNYQLVSSMGDVAESQAILDTTAKLSVAGFTEYSSAMNGLVAVLNGFKLGAKEAGEVADVLMTVQNRGITTVNELQGSLAEVSSVAYNANVGFKDIAAALATITSNKVGTAEAVTGLKGALLELMQDGSQASKNFKKATGEAFDQFTKNHSLVEAIQRLDEYAKKSGISLANIFGNVRAGVSFMNLAGENLNKFKADMEAVENATGTADQAMAKLDEGAERTFSKLKEQANYAVREIGEALIPKVKELTDKLAEIDWKAVFSEENINKIVKTAKVIGGVSLAIYGLNTALGVVDTFLKTATGLKMLFSLIGSSLFTKVMVSAGTGAYTGLGIAATPAAYATGLSSTGLGILAASGLALNYAAQKTTENVVGQTRDTSGMNTAEKLKSLREEIELTTKQIKAFKETSDGTEDTITITGLETATQKLSKLKEEYERLKYEFHESNEDTAIEIEKIADTVDKITSNLNDTKTSVNTENTDIDSIKNLMKEYQDFITKTPKFWDLIGLDDKKKLEEKVSFFKSALQKAVDLGATHLIPRFKSEFDKAENELTLKIKSFDFSKAEEDLKKKLSNLDGDGIVNLGKKGIERDVAEYQAISQFLETIKSGTTELEKQRIIELEQRKEALAQKIKLDNEEKEAQKKKIESYDSAVQSISALANGLSALASVTGSKRIGGLSSLVQGGLSLGKTFLNLKSGADTLGSLASITKAGSWFSTAGITGIGSIVGGITAGVGIVKGIGSIIGSSGKKKKAKIDASNKENENRYEEQVKAMQQLTQALMQNSERIKSFSDRMLTDVAKNPTLRNILGGESNFTTVYDAMIQGKHFNDIDAIEKGSAKYRSGFRKKRKDTFTAVKIEEDKLLKHLGFDKTELDLFTDDEMRQLNGVLNTVNHDMLRRATGRDLTKSNIEEWKAQINEFVAQIDLLDKEKKELFRGSTLESLSGIEYKAEKDLIAEYTEQFKQLGLVGEQYNETIKEMARNNQVFVTTMQDVRASTIEALSTNTGSFTSSMKGYFEKIYKNASSIAYDVAFSDMDSYFNKEFEKISEKLVEIKRTGKLDFSDLFVGFDFEQLKLAEINEIQAKKSLDGLKQQLLNSGIDLSIVNKILPQSDFNDRINDLKNSLSSAMSAGLEEHKFDSFTKSLGQSLYDSTKSSLVKAFSESSLYQGMIQKFVNVEDFKSKLEAAGSFKEAFTLSENLLKKFGYEMEANGFGGFDAINNKADVETQLGNAYYQDKVSNVNVNVTNNFNREVYGVEDFKNIILDTTEKGIKLFFEKPKVLSI